MKTRIHQLLVFLSLLSPFASNGQTYDSENLSSGSLVGQDGWVGSGLMQVATGTLLNSSKVLTGTAPGTPLINSRVNNASFSFPTLSSSDKAVILQFDYRVENNLAEIWFGVGVDRNGNGTIEGTSERGFGFGHYRNSIGITDASTDFQLSGSHAGYREDFGDIIRLRLVVDMTGYNGHGSASLYYQNLSDGDTGFTLAYDDQDIGIREADHTPEHYNGVFLAVSAGAQVDNFIIVPEPSASLLLCGGGLFAALFRRRKVA